MMSCYPGFSFGEFLKCIWPINESLSISDNDWADTFVLNGGPLMAYSVEKLHISKSLIFC